MKRLILLILLSLAMTTTSVNAEVHEMKATAYCIQGQTASGTNTRYGICAGKPEWIGKKASVFLKYNAHYLGTYIVEDTGGESIKNGEVLDLWFQSEDLCKKFGCVDVRVVIEE